MELVKKMLWLLFVINTLDKISVSSASTPSALADQVKNILESCFADRLNPIVISDDLTEIVYKEMINFPVLVINEGFKAKMIKPYFNPRYPTYVLTVHSVKKLKTTLQEFATLSTWSIESIFFVVRYSEVNCDDEGRKVLEILWKIDQLTAFYICFQPGKSIDGTDTMIYTVNPFSKRASLPWKEVSRTQPISASYPEQNDNKRPTLYKQPYENDSKLCLSLKFDKTEHLDGYSVTACKKTSSKTEQFLSTTVKLDNLRNSMALFFFSYFSTLFSALNASSVVTTYRDGYFSNNMSLCALNTMINGKHDICLDLMFISTPGYDSVGIFNLNIRNELFILSHKNGAQKPIENRPYASISIVVIVSFFVLLLSYTIIVINKINNLNNFDAADVNDDPEYGNSFLDIISFIVSAGILTPINSLSMRVMFVITTLLVFIVSPDILGNLTSASTKQEYAYPKSIKDLFDLKYNVYFNPNLRNTFINKKDDLNTSLDLLHSPIRSIHKCHERILNDPTIACVFFNPKQIEMAFEYEFPLTMTFEIDKCIFFWSRKNWPLKKKVDIITLRFHESGFMKYWSKQEIYLPLKKLRAKERSKSLSEYIPTEFEDLKFLYICLALLTLLLSVLALIFEVFIARRIIRLQRMFINERRHRIGRRLQKFKKDNRNDRFLQDKVRIVKGRVVILP